MEYLIDKINEIGNPPRVSSERTRKRHPHDHAPPLPSQSPLRKLLPPLQPPRARSSFNKRSSEALSNYIYSLLGRKLPAPGRCGKNWEIKINPPPQLSRARLLACSAPFLGLRARPEHFVLEFRRSRRPLPLT